MTVDAELKMFHLRYKGIFDLEGLYRMVYNWLHERGYDTQEKKYKHKPSSPWGYKHEIFIEAEKKIDNYYQYKLNIDFYGKDISEVEHNGKRLANGRMHIIFKGKVIGDYQKRWERNAFTKFLQGWYYRIIRREFEMKHWDELHYKLHFLQSDMKKHLNMYTQENYFK